jgi:hypothetical protein
MDLQTLSSLHNIFQEVQQKPDWRAALDTLFVSLRDSFIFDNVAIYLKDPHTKGLDVVYARAVGRGKTAEADVVWGESLASEVIAKGEMILKEPKRVTGKTGRLDLAVRSWVARWYSSVLAGRRILSCIFKPRRFKHFGLRR